MSYNNRRKPRSYVYRIPLDDRTALRKINVYESLREKFWIRKLKDSEVPNVNATKNWSVAFYESKEHFDHDTNQMVGGTIEGLEEYRYSLDWEPHPETSLLEMKYVSGGSKIRGEQYLGTSDPRLPNYVPVEFTVPWTPNEIKKMYNGEPVENKTNYSYREELPGGKYVRRRPDELEDGHGRMAFQEQLRYAEEEGFEKLKKKLHEHMENCDHDHVVEEYSEYIDRTEGYCEDCGKSWENEDELEYAKENEDLTVVSSA